MKMRKMVVEVVQMENGDVGGSIAHRCSAGAVKKVAVQLPRIS